MIRFLFILLTLSTFPIKAQLNFDFARSFGSTGTESGKAVTFFSDGSLLLAGSFGSTTDFDLTPGVFNITPSAGIDAFMARYDSAYNLLWIKTFTGSGDSYIDKIIINENDDILVCGSFSYACDFDPSPSTFILNATLTDTYFAKYNSSGNFIFAKKIGGSGDDDPNDFHTDIDGNIYVIGSFNSTCDFNPGSATYNLTASSTDAFIAKYNSLGNFIWAYKLGGSSFDIGYSITTDSIKNVYITGFFENTVDFDLGSGTFNKTADQMDVYIEKIDSAGNFLWMNAVGGPGYDKGLKVLMFNHELLVTGIYDGGIDFDPGPGIVYPTLGGTKNAFIAKYNINDGSFIELKSFGATVGSEIYIEQTKLDEDQNIYICGYYSGSPAYDGGTPINEIVSWDMFLLVLSPELTQTFLQGIGGAGGYDYINDIAIFEEHVVTTGNFSAIMDFDPTSYVQNITSSGGQDGFIQSFHIDTCSYFQLSSPIVQEINCTDSMAHVTCTVTSGIAPYTYEWKKETVVYSTDTILNTPNPGVYQYKITDSLGCSKEKNVFVNSFTMVSTFDLSAYMSSAPPFYAGHTTMVFLHGLNNGCTPVSGSMIFILDSLVELISAYSTPPDMILGDSLIWNFTDLTYDSISFTPVFYLLTNTSTIYDQPLSFTLIINPLSGDEDTTNNIKPYHFIGSPYDPNLKQVYPQGVNDNHGILNNQTMTYSVNFQNTGTAEAINVYVLDTLDPNLDFSSLHIINSSHYMYTEVLSGNILKFNFPNIHLPDSTSDEPNSHGYFIYKLNQLPDLTHNTVIENTAAIYFDYNDPVLTNTAFNTIDLGAEVYALNDTLCAGDSTTLSIVPHVPDLPTHWQWFEGSCTGSFAGNGNNIVAIPSSTTAYYAKDTNTGLCFEQVISVNNINTTVTETDPTLTAYSSVATFQWIDCNAGFTPLAGESNQSYTATLNGNYAVIITQGGCTDTSACYSVISTGISESPNRNVMVYPNPVNNELNIAFNNTTSPADITLTDMTGQIVMHQILNIEHDPNDLSLSKFQITGLETGLYCLQIRQGQNITITKLVKK